MRNKAGTFRIRIKLHKDPVVGRPSLNLGKSWLAPAAAFLVETLKPAASSLSYVVQSSMEILDLLSELRVTESTCLATFDISNLYPGVDRTHFMTCLARRIRTFWAAKASFASFLITLVEFVLGFQFINHSDQIWRVDKGLPTGLSASVIFANLYLADLDDFVLNECGCVLTWRRYTDDAFALLHSLSESDVKFVQQQLNKWHPAIQWKVSFSGKEGCVSRFGHLAGSGAVCDPDASQATERIPLHSQDLLPSKIRLHCIDSRRAQRLFRHNCQNAGRLRHHIGFFLRRLQRRGVSVAECSQHIEKTLQTLSLRKQRVRQENKFFFRQTYTST